VVDHCSFNEKHALHVVPQNWLIVKTFLYTRIFRAIFLTFAAFHCQNNNLYVMNNLVTLSAEFERQKNIRAMAYTAGLAGLILLLIIFVKWAIPQNIQPVVDDFVEINMGNSLTGSGTDQPLSPGDASPAQQVAYNSPAPASSAAEDVKDVSNENETSHEAPPVVKPVVSKPTATKINSESKVVKTHIEPTPIPPTPAPPRPKALMNGTRGGTVAGNGADTYKPGAGEGVTGGRGDQGVVGGNPNGKNYSGTPRTLSAQVVNMPTKSFQDDFNESGKIALDVVVDENGHLQSASYQINGSTLARSSKQYDIALRRAKELDYPKLAGGFQRKLIMNFSVK
jgi:hypothetical protein